MTALTPLEGIVLLSLFAAIMFTMVFKGRGKVNADEFLLANRQVSTFRGAFSIAVSWIWAPAIFICSLQAYKNGLAGVFWFTLPNILCFFAFAPFAVRIRKMFPLGYSFPEAIDKRFQSRRTHLAFLLLFFGSQLGAVIINSLAGGLLLYSLTGIDPRLAAVSMTCIALAYSLCSGLRASIKTDVLQMGLLLTVAFIVVPWCLQGIGGAQTLEHSLYGIGGEIDSVLDPWIAFSMGIPMTIGLLAGPFADQMFFQRTFAVRADQVSRTFIFGGLLFGVVPILLSTLGFIGVQLSQAGHIVVDNPEMVGPQVIAFLLPKPALYLFCIMTFAGLCSTMDSAFCAISSLSAVDVYRRYFRAKPTDSEIVLVSRNSMVLFAVAGTAIALLQPKILWVFLMYGAMVAAGMFPAIFAFCSQRVSEKAVFWGIVSGIIIGLPFSVYANIIENPYWIVASSMLSISVGLVVCSASVINSRINEPHRVLDSYAPAS